MPPSQRQQDNTHACAPPWSTICLCLCNIPIQNHRIRNVTYKNRKITGLPVKKTLKLKHTHSARIGMHSGVVLMSDVTDAPCVFPRVRHIPRIIGSTSGMYAASHQNTHTHIMLSPCSFVAVVVVVGVDGIIVAVDVATFCQKQIARYVCNKRLSAITSSSDIISACVCVFNDASVRSASERKYFVRSFFSSLKCWFVLRLLARFRSA